MRMPRRLVLFLAAKAFKERAAKLI